MDLFLKLLLPAMLAFVLAAFISSLELITAKYPQTYSFLRKNAWLYLYAAIYGAIACGIWLGLDALTTNGTITLTGLGLSSPWVRAVAVAVTVKAFLHINLFNVTVGSQSTPVGIETFVQLFEPALLRNILLNEFNAVRRYIQPRAVHYNNLADDKATINGNIPDSMPGPEQAAFQNDVDKAETVTVAMEHFLRFLGRNTFDRVFPL